MHRMLRQIPRSPLLVLVLLLPLRLWAAQVMPVLSHGPVQQPEQVAMAPCHDHQQGQTHSAASADADAADPTDRADGAQAHGACDQCQLCHAGALPWALMATAAAPCAHPWQATAVATPAGTEPGSAFKPPIS